MKVRFIKKNCQKSVQSNTIKPTALFEFQRKMLEAAFIIRNEFSVRKHSKKDTQKNRNIRKTANQS